MMMMVVVKQGEGQVAAASGSLGRPTSCLELCVVCVCVWLHMSGSEAHWHGGQTGAGPWGFRMMGRA